MKFSKDVWHVVANDELIILDAMTDNFILFNKQDTSSILGALVDQSICKSTMELLDIGILEHSLNPQIINRSYTHGLDDFTWSESMRFKTLHCQCDIDVRAILLAIGALMKAYLKIKVGKLSSILEKNDLPIKKPINLPEHIIKKEINSLVFASRLVPFKVACFEFSVALQDRLLSGHGTYTSLIIGVQKYSFMAHAWLELNGKPLGEPDYVSMSLHKLR
ncbi:lasso peptide biosynthesis B2 protein [Marinomonas rhizomae]|uniref:lasso peptide biosynthesis B2 protein n=1 Tax=Marinomonas rhizomae TaxID=491948 RepID=UPI0011BFC21B|nr:lasso peptide biosynthesis B2 protein [Marinomonas rhizomae]